MIIEINPKKDYRTQVPIYIKITDSLELPRVKVSGVGEIPVKKTNNFYQSHFYIQKSGIYKLEISNPIKKVVKTLNVSEQTYLSFSKEFGAFSVIFIIVMLGVILWTRKIMIKS